MMIVNPEAYLSGLYTVSAGGLDGLQHLARDFKLNLSLAILSPSSCKEMRICNCIAVGDPLIKRKEEGSN